MSNPINVEEILKSLPKLKWPGKVGWRDKAACRTVPTDTFFEVENRREAKSLCMKCDARLDCLEFALVNGIKDGIYGGFTSLERSKLKDHDIYLG